MVDITRRTFVISSLGLFGAGLLPRFVWAGHGNANAMAGQPPWALPQNGAAMAPREQWLFDFGWQFAFGHGDDPAKDFGFGFGQGDFSKTGTFKIATTDFDAADWRKLNLPHDWAVELPFVHDDKGDEDSRMTSHGYKPLGRRYPATSVGWYRRTFDIPDSDRGRRIWIEFDGAMRDVMLFVNGCFIGRHDDGYTSFRFDVTDFLNYGGKNVVALRVDASFGDGWFYEGAGIYRHVWLTKMDPVHLGRWESVVRPTLKGDTASLDLATIIQNENGHPVNASLAWTIVDASGRTVAQATSAAQAIAPSTSTDYRAAATIDHPALWSPDEPHLYTALVKVFVDGSVRDAEHIPFGIRTARFDPDHGFFLNDKPLKIQGTCNHQDHAGVGAALPDRLQAFRLSVLQSMGCNAVRTSHNMPTPEWVEACDRMGMLMMCETRHMSASPSGLEQLETMVKRYRNSPSIIIWSIGNEEWKLQKGDMAAQGERIATTMVERCHELDPTRVVSAAVNGDNEQGVSDALDIIGFNYHTDFPDDFHKKHPKRPVFGSETSSAISTRGEYSSDKTKNTVNSYDGVVDWGQTPEQWWTFYDTREWLAGGFAWTGFDYRGEPTPYGWPSISSQFGIVDMCGFPKDYYYYYKAWWRKEPSLHVFPHWNWQGKEGQDISVWVYTNLDEVELLLNGKSLGSKKVPRLGHIEWKVAYAPGVIEARGSRNGQTVLVEKRETTGPAQKIRLIADRSEIAADGQDVTIITVEALDDHGRLVPTADNKLAFRISGKGQLIGVGNGNPNCLESDKEPKRSLFNGLAQVIIQSTDEAGQVLIEAVEEGAVGQPLRSASMAITTKRPASKAQRVS
ncbi:beta-galactosidase GalA [Dyella nitratireducens]|uniref:Beta-galactosidase n=1 Tax=Dyella nitratireducens TaxID=1849580 RepID=A0ABQ1G9M2_9GAMM|nr:beta-galactosidase GalA [Dyella nitratireducens]GGA39459.1 beta-galactosidase [Dyella nitratireducens]GLQ40442.1 beta-galactosidase [Dyella nitratireducens]